MDLFVFKLINITVYFVADRLHANLEASNEMSNASIDVIAMLTLLPYLLLWERRLKT